MINVPPTWKKCNEEKSKWCFYDKSLKPNVNPNNPQNRKMVHLAMSSDRFWSIQSTSSYSEYLSIIFLYLQKSPSWDHLPATQSCILSASRTLHSSVHLVKAVGMLERVPVQTKQACWNLRPILNKRNLYKQHVVISTCLCPSIALLVEKVFQQLVIRTSNDMNIFIPNQKPSATTRLQRQSVR